MGQFREQAVRHVAKLLRLDHDTFNVKLSRTWEEHLLIDQRELVLEYRAALAEAVVPLAAIKDSVQWELCDEIKVAVDETLSKIEVLLNKTL